MAYTTDGTEFGTEFLMHSEMSSNALLTPTDPVTPGPNSPSDFGHPATAAADSVIVATPSNTKPCTSDKKEIGTMMANILDIFTLDETPQPAQDDIDLDEDAEEVEVEVDLEGQTQRTDRLKMVLPTLERLWWSDSEHMALVAEKLADGSRDSMYSRDVEISVSLIAITFFYQIVPACVHYFSLS